MCKVDPNKPSVKYINPLTDYGFKKIFSDPKVMLGLITDIIQPKSPIAELIFIDPNEFPRRKEERGIIYDLRCKTEDGEEFIVEMQKRSQDYFADRIIYYLSCAIAPQGEKGLVEVMDEQGQALRKSWNYELHPVYGIFFMNFHLDKNNPQPLRTLQYMDKETGKVFSEKIKAFAIELPCYNKKNPEDCRTGIERWTYFLNNLEDLQEGQPFAKESPAFERAYEIAELSKMSAQEREKYRYYFEQERSNQAAYEYARKEDIQNAREQGLQEGLEQGMQKGRAEGRIEGRAEGERNKAITMAKQMKADGMPVEVIAKYTGLSLEEIEKLE